MKQKTDILKSVENLKQFKDGVLEFKKELKGYDTSPKKRYVITFQYIIASGDKFDGTLADMKNAFRLALGAKTKFNERTARFLFKKLASWIDRFVIMKKIEESGQVEIEEGQYHRENGRHKLMKQAMGAALDKAIHAKEATRHYINSRVYKELYYHGKGDKRDPKFQQLLFKADEELDNCYLADKLKNLIEKLYLCTEHGKEFGATLLRHVESCLGLLPQKPIPLIQLQVLVIEYYLNPSLETYERYRRAYFEYVRQISSEQKYLLVSLMNSLAFTPPGNGVMQEFLSLFKFGFDHNIFLEDGELEDKLFNNFVFVLKSLEEYDLLKDFIETHQHLIKDENERDNAVKMGKCYMKAGRGKFFTARLDLYQVEPYYPIFYLRKYALDIVCCYMDARNKYDAFLEIEGMEDRFKVLLNKYKREKRININYYKTYMNFFTFMLNISNIKDPENTKKSLSDQLEEYGGKITEKHWLLKMVAAMPIWTNIEKIKNIYDTTWKKYDALEEIQVLTVSLKRRLLRYKKAGYMHQETQKKCLNFLNIIFRICDERNPKNSRRHLIQLLKSFDEQVIEKKWLEEKIKKIRL